MSIAQTPPRGVNPSLQQPATLASAVFATLHAASRDSQVTRGAALAVLDWFANESNAWTRFTVTRLTSSEMLGISRKTVYRALEVLFAQGYLEERPVRDKSREREARIIVVGAPGGAQ